MHDHFAVLKQAERHLSTLRQSLPDFGATLDHHLLTRYTHLPATSCTDDLFVTYEAQQEPGQPSRLVSDSLTHLIKQGYSRVQLPTYTQGSTYLYNHAYSLNEADRTPGISIIQVEEFIRDVVNNLERVVQNAVTHCWKTPRSELEGMTPRNWLCRFFRGLVNAEAELRHADKTLSDTARSAVQTVLNHETYQKRLHSNVDKPLTTYSIALKGEIEGLDIPLHGLLVIADHTASSLDDATYTFKLASALLAADQPATSPTRKVVLYVPGSGLEEFDSLQALSQEIQARFEDIYQRENLLDYVLLSDRTRALTLREIGFREVKEDAWAACTDDLIDTFAPNIRHAWATARANNRVLQVEALADDIEKAIDASLGLKPANILQTRYTRLLENQLPEWIKRAPEAQKQQWRQAVAGLAFEHQASQTLDTQDFFYHGQKNSLLGYARAQLKQRIKANHNIEVDPDAIMISTTEALNTGPGFYPLNPTGSIAGGSIHRTGPSITYQTTRRSLSELALDNIGKLDLTFALTARVQDAAGNNHPVLTSAYVKALVRELDVGNSYSRLISRSLLYTPEKGYSSPQAQWRKERYVAVTTAQLRLNLLEASLNDNPAHALTPLEMSWVENLLSHPAEHGRPKVNNTSLKVNVLLLNRYAVPGVWVITARPSTRKICYTPDAPDHVWFRKADTLDELALQLSTHALHDYLLQRVTAAQQPYVLPLLKAGLGPTDVQIYPVSKHFLEAAYDIEAQFAIRSANEQSTSTFESNVQTAKNVIWSLVDIISFVLPIKILLPLVLARFLYSVGDGIDALQRDEKHEALMHFLGSIAHLTDGASDFAGSAVFGRAIRQRVALTPRMNPKTFITRTTTARMTLRTGEHYGSGIHELLDPGNGQLQHYLNDANGNLHRCQYDHLNEIWRLLDERQLDRVYRPPVFELSAGRWQATPSTSARQQPLTLQELVDRYLVQTDIGQITPDAQGIYTATQAPLSPQSKQTVHHFIEQNGVVFEVKKDWLGRHWYLYNADHPRGSHLIYKVRRHAETGHWEVKNRQLDHTKRWEPLMINTHSLAPDMPTTVYSNYLAWAEHVPALEKITASASVDFNRYSFRTADMESARLHIHHLQIRMFEEAQTFLGALVLKQRLPLPEIAQSASLETLFTHLHKKHNGVIIGESHSASSSKKIIKDTLALQAKNNVKTLYMEHLQADLHQAHLDTFFNTGNVPSSLESFLIRLDNGYSIDPTSLNSFTSPVLATRHHGIRVIALDCVASYYPKGIDAGQPNTARYQLLSYGASQIIRAHQAHVGEHKWIALTGNTHSNTYQGIPGLAELENAIGVRVTGVTPGTSQGIRRDCGMVYSPLLSAEVSLLKSDFLLEMEVPGIRPKIPGLTESMLSNMLKSRGDFTLDVDAHQWPELIHRSTERQIVRTPLQTTAEGMIFIERPKWTDIHKKPYATLMDLVRALEGKHMVHINM